jgi:hypothetical protein
MTKNTIAVTVDLKYRFEDFEIGTVLKSGDDYFMKVSNPKYPLVDLAKGHSIHWGAVNNMKFELLNVGTRLTIIISGKQRMRVHNAYKRVNRSEVDETL